MQSNWWQMIGLTALIWLMMSDTISQLIPVPVPVFDPTELQAVLPELEIVDGKPAFQKLIDQQWNTSLADPTSELGILFAAAKNNGGPSAWPSSLPVIATTSASTMNRNLLRFDQLLMLQTLWNELEALKKPDETRSESIQIALRQQPPDPTYAVSILLAWYAAAEKSLATGTPLPEAPLGSPLFSAAALRPLAERMVEPLSVSMRSKGFSEYISHDLLGKRRALYLRTLLFSPSPQRTPLTLKTGPLL